MTLKKKEFMEYARQMNQPELHFMVYQDYAISKYVGTLLLYNYCGPSKSVVCLEIQVPFSDDGSEAALGLFRERFKKKALQFSKWLDDERTDRIMSWC